MLFEFFGRFNALSLQATLAFALFVQLRCLLAKAKSLLACQTKAKPSTWAFRSIASADFSTLISPTIFFF